MDRSLFNQSFFQFMADTQKVAYDLTIALQPEGLTNKSFSVLEHLYYFNDQSIKQVSQALALSEASMRRLMNSLHEDQLVFRKKVGRAYSYRLTKEGKVKLDACFFQVAHEISEKYRHLDDKTLLDLKECMTYIAKKMY